MSAIRPWLVMLGALALLGTGCAAKELYWTKGRASEKQFRADSMRCRDWAGDEMVDIVSSRGDRVCTTDSRYGTYCRSTRPRNEWEAQEQERRNQRQLERLYAVCMRDRGWQSNTEGVGYASGTKG